MKILVSYRGIPQSPGWATGDMVVKAFRALGHDAYPFAKYYQQSKWVEPRPPLDKYDWDLILYMECNDGDPQYIDLAVARARQTACWLFDTSYHQDRYRKLVDYFRFDHIFLANPLTAQEYKVWGYDNVSYLPYACDPELHGRPLEHPKTMDVALVGSVRDDRRALVGKLRKLGLKAELVGGVFREEYIDTLASARIILNQNPTAGRGLLNMRFFESPAAGALVLTEAEDFEAQPHLDWEESTHRLAYPYNSPEEIAGFCGAILQEPDRLDNARMLVQNAALMHHTYEKRCQRLLERVFPYERIG